MKKLIVLFTIFFAVSAFAGDMTTRVPDNQLNSHFTESISDGANGSTIRIVMAPGAKLSCTVIAGANTGKIQWTTSSDALITAGTQTWIDWPKGNVTGTDWDYLEAPVTAVRGVSISGAVVVNFVQ